MNPTEKKLLNEAAVADKVHRDRAATRQSYTPEPWVLQDCADGIQIYGPEGFGEKVALVNGATEHRSWERVKANARLLVAAPTMLATLKIAEKFYVSELEAIGECDHSVGICCCGIVSELENLREVIAEAEVR